MRTDQFKASQPLFKPTSIQPAYFKYLNEVLYTTVCVSLNMRFNPYQRLDLGIQSVGHQFKVAIRRYERDCPVILKS